MLTGDVIDIINNHPSNTNPADQVVARLARFGNGIELVDDNNGGPSPLIVRAASFAANDLGFVPDGERTISSSDLGTTASAATATATFCGSSA